MLGKVAQVIYIAGYAFHKVMLTFTMPLNAVEEQFSDLRPLLGHG